MHPSSFRVSATRSASSPRTLSETSPFILTTAVTVTRPVIFSSRVCLLTVNFPPMSHRDHPDRQHLVLLLTSPPSLHRRHGDDEVFRLPEKARRHPLVLFVSQRRPLSHGGGDPVCHFFVPDAEQELLRRRPRDR